MSDNHSTDGSHHEGVKTTGSAEHTHNPTDDLYAQSKQVIAYLKQNTEPIDNRDPEAIESVYDMLENILTEMHKACAIPKDLLKPDPRKLTGRKWV